MSHLVYSTICSDKIHCAQIHNNLILHPVYTRMWRLQIHLHHSSYFLIECVIEFLTLLAIKVRTVIRIEDRLFAYLTILLF